MGNALATNEGWTRRGALAKTPAAVNPGGHDGWWMRWSRDQLQTWGMRRVRRYTGGQVGLAVDLGCGYGDWTTRLCAVASRVIAVDVAPGFVAETRARLAATGHASWRVACADVRTFHDYAGADLVHLGGVLTYLDGGDALDVLASVRARLAPGGVLHQRDWCAIGLGRPSHQERDGIASVHRSPAQYVDLARRAGLRLIEQRRSAGIYGEELGLRLRIGRWLPSLAWRIATAHWRRGSVSFFFRRA